MKHPQLSNRTIQIILSILLLILIINLITSNIFNFSILPTLASNTKSGYHITVDVDTHELKVYLDNKIVNTYPISTGAPSTPSPLGTWIIVSKANWGEGFGGTWMGFNVPWGKYGIHGTDEPWTIGKSQSKGCIRMYNKDADELKKIIPHGTEVTIKKGESGPFGYGYRTLKPGDIGADVYALQELLKEKGYYPNWVDGKYGNGMEKAVYKFQKENGLPRSKYITKEFYAALGIDLKE